jgi:hypothetical protein
MKGQGIIDGVCKRWFNAVKVGNMLGATVWLVVNRCFESQL